MRPERMNSMPRGTTTSTAGIAMPCPTCYGDGVETKKKKIER